MLGSKRLLIPSILFALVARADAVIIVETAVNSDRGVRTQAVITESSGVNEGGSSVTAVAIKEVHAAIFVIDTPISRRGAEAQGGGLSVVKQNLTAAEAYGLGLPNGYNVPPTTDPTGPWQGLVWPYRDQYDYFPGPLDPLADDVGTFFTIEPNVYGFLDVDGIARGGPTDPTPAGGDITRLLRGITGNGLNGPATYFAFDVTALSGDPDRFVEVRVLSTSARVVVQDNVSGAYSEINVPVAPFTTFVQLPEPSAALILPLIAAAARRRRR